MRTFARLGGADGMKAEGRRPKPETRKAGTGRGGRSNWLWRTRLSEAFQVLRHCCLIAALHLSLPSSESAGARTGGGTADGPYRWYSVPIEVKGLPAQGEFIPVSTFIDFSALLAQLDVPGAVDERSLRLDRLAAGTARQEVALQFSPAAQPRPKQRRVLPDSPPNVSYLGEYAAGETPEAIKVAGDLVWIVRGRSDGTQAYVLRFGVLEKGRMVQVPFPPQNLRAFDEQGRGSPVRWFPKLQIRPQWPMDGQVRIFEGQNFITAYHTGPVFKDGFISTSTVRRPFFYPVNGPDGISLTEFGKPHDPTGSHAHHYSLWIAHASVDGRDFWSERGGIIAHEQLELMEDGPVFCRLVQKTRWVDQGEELVRERRSFTIYETGDGFRVMDLELSFTPAGQKPLTFGKTTFGFLAARVAQSMTVFDGAGEITNAHGDLNEQGAHLKRAPWIDQSGPIGQGLWNGVAIFDHPENPNHPTGWHCRNDGWTGAAFNMDNAWTLKPGDSLRLRYRLHLHRHDAKRGAVALRYEEYRAKPILVLGEAKIEAGSR